MRSRAVRGGDGESDVAPMSAEARRAYKVERHRRARAAREARDAMRAVRERRGDAAGGGEEAADAGFADESEWRAAELALCASDAFEALDALEGAMRELEMLEFVERRRAAAGGSAERAAAELQRERDDLRRNAPPPQKPVTILPGQLGGSAPPPSFAPGQLAGASGSAVPLDEARTRIAQQVFRPSHILPTYTPEQAAMLDMQEGRFLSGGQNDKETEESEDEDADIDNAEKLKKARDWDDFKDDNPKGAGNRSRMG